MLLGHVKTAEIIWSLVSSAKTRGFTTVPSTRRTRKGRTKEKMKKTLKILRVRILRERTR
jgi:hypothetical protein